MLPSSFPSALGQTRIYLYAQPADMRNYAVTVIMRSRDALNAIGGDRACVMLCIMGTLFHGE